MCTCAVDLPSPLVFCASGPAQYREQRKQAQLNNPHYLKPAKNSPTPTRRGEEMAAKLDVSSIPVSRLELGVDLVIGQ